MVVRCCVSGCKTTETDCFHSFPSNQNIRNELIMRTKVLHLNKDELVRSWSKVCRKHFLECDFYIDFRGKKRLNPKAVPTLFLPNVAEHNYTKTNVGVSEICHLSIEGGRVHVSIICFLSVFRIM